MPSLLSFMLGFVLSGPALAAGSFRADLHKALQPKFCQNFGSMPSTQELWQLGIYESQLEAAWIRSSDALLAIKTAELAQLASEQALAKQHQGFAYGLCNAEQGWIISSPAASSFLHRDQAGLHLDLTLWQGRCAEISLDFAGAVGGIPRRILRQSTQLHAELLLVLSAYSAGTLGFTCHPADRRKAGPQLWALLPVHGGERLALPAWPLVDEQPESLISWIAAIRAAHGLPPLRMAVPALDQLAKQLAAEITIQHPHALLLQQRKLLQEQHIVLLGEDRVIAGDLRQMAWLLWMSPSHRALLLHKEATALAYDFAAFTRQKLLVLLLAKI